MNANQRAAAEAQEFVSKLNEVILFPLVYLLMAIAFFNIHLGDSAILFKR